MTLELRWMYLFDNRSLQVINNCIGVSIFFEVLCVSI